MLKVTKFGGSSLCDSAGFSRVREIVLADPARRVVIVSAAGKRHAADHKITDLLYLCHAHLQYGVSCWDLWRRIADRYREIRDGCCLTLPIEAELDAIYAAMRRDTPRDWIVSRGEYLSARLMADLLGFEFVDAKDWLLFDAAGRIRQAASYAALGSLADGRKIVTPGFYGALPDGKIHTLPRGGSDVTGALAAAALHADLYENWTDVTGVLAADPRLIQNPAPVGQLRHPLDDLCILAGGSVIFQPGVIILRQPLGSLPRPLGKASPRQGAVGGHGDLILPAELGHLPLLLPEDQVVVALDRDEFRKPFLLGQRVRLRQLVGEAVGDADIPHLPSLHHPV